MGQILGERTRAKGVPGPRLQMVVLAGCCYDLGKSCFSPAKLPNHLVGPETFTWLFGLRGKGRRQGREEPKAGAAPL